MNLRLRSFAEYTSEYERSIKDPEGFWASIADRFDWYKKWENVLNWNFDEPKISWFQGGQLNITVNALDRFVAVKPSAPAYIFEPNSPSDPSKVISYQELYESVNKFANGLRSIGVSKGDRIIIYMPMIPEAAIAILACARIGAVHSIVFAGFSSQALADRANDASAKVIVTTSGLKRGEKEIALKNMVDEAMTQCTSVEHVVCMEYANVSYNWNEKTDIRWHDLINEQSTECIPEIMNAEDPLFILYTSGSTGKPKGVVHTCGGYMIYTAYTFQNVFQYEEGDVFWCTADIGWITGHSYIIYGPLLSGATSVLFEGIPTYPDAGRFWEVCEKHSVNQFYTAPTAIRSLMSYDNSFVTKYDLSKLKVIGSVGEPINEEAWQWYHKMVGKEKCPIVDTWWQTETGGILLSGLGDLSPMIPTYAGYPLPGIQPVLLDNDGNELNENDVEGYLCMKFPWPSIIRTTYGDHERCRTTYFSTYKGYYFTGDGARRNKDGMYRIIGRVDDVINVSGHRFGTAEIEDAINTSEYVIESAVVGFPHEIKGQGIFAYVVTDPKIDEEESYEAIIRSATNSIEKQIGKIAKPDKILVVSGLPKTRSGKIMRRILRKIAEGERMNFGDTSTLLDPGIVDEILHKIDR